MYIMYVIDYNLQRCSSKLFPKCENADYGKLNFS